MFGLAYGMVQVCFAKKEYSVALLGLSEAGKTTLAEKIKCTYNGGQMKKIIPTVGLNVIRVDLPTLKLRLWDLSGETGMRKIWPNYTHDSDAIIYCIDSSNKECLESLVKSNTFKDIPLLILNNNKANEPGSMNDDEIAHFFEIDSKLQISIKSCKVVSCNAVEGTGLRPGVDWLADQLLLLLPKQQAYQ